MKEYLSRLFIAFALVSQTILLSPPISIAAVQSPKRVDLIVSGGTVVTMDKERRVIEDGAVAVERGRIVAVGKSSDIARQYAAREVIDARGRAVVPGLINGHTHVPMTLFRGIADDLDLNEWLTKYIFPAEAKNVTEEFVRVGTQLGLAEMIRGGTTTYCDMYYFEDAVADETQRAGVRGVLGETVIDFPVPDTKTWADAMRYTDNFVRKWKGNTLVTPAIAPHAPYTVSEAHLREVKAFSDRTGAPIVTHVAETRKEVEDISRDHGARDVLDLLARLGDVRDYGRARSVGEGFDFAQVRFVDRVGGVRRDGRRDEHVALPLLNEVVGVAHRVGPGLVVGNGEVNHGLADPARTSGRRG